MNHWNLTIIPKYGKIGLIVFLFPFSLLAQQKVQDSLLEHATLENCIHYAIQKNPDLQNARIEEDITETIIKSKLAEWYPQVNFNYDLQYNFQLPTININGNLIRSGSVNTSGIQFGATQ